MTDTAPTQTSAAKLPWTPHPLIDRDPNFRALNDAEFGELADVAGEDAALAYFEAREQRIKESVADPFKHEFPLPHWADVEKMVQEKLVTFIPGGNNPGKSWWSGSFVMRVITRKFGWEGISAGKLQVLMISQDDTASTMFQQPAVYAHFPAAWRKTNESAKKPQGFAKSINYTEKNGFTEGSFVLPKPLRGQVWFKTVAQYLRDSQSFEGPAYDLVVVDEGCPLALFNSLKGRVSKRGGRLIYLLTCVNGFDLTMGHGLSGARLVKSLPMQWDMVAGRVDPDIVFPELKVGEHQTDLLKRLLCPAGHMPYIMQPLDINHGVIFMWNTFNPFQPRSKWNPKMPAMFDAAVGQPRWKVIVMLFGWIERVGQLALGNFNPEAHVVRGDQREALDKMVREGKATVYNADDPETQRSHALLWLAVFPPQPAWPQGLKYLFDESPRSNEGPWVDGHGNRGEGQYCYKATGANWYKRYIRDRERSWNIAEHGRAALRPADAPALSDGCHECVVNRRGDPRGFATEESTATGTRSLFDLYLEDHTGEHADCYPMVFTPAKIRRASTLDIDIIIGMLKYDEDRATREGGMTAENTPQLLVSERCENFIACALNYTLTDLGKADEDNPYRDFIDSLRYLLSSDTPYIDVTASMVTGGGAW